MENETNIAKDTLIQAVRGGYGLEITTLDFLLRGFGGDCYRAETSVGTSYFVKVHDPVANQMTAASSRAFYLPLMHQLHAKGILPDIPYPLQTLDGELSLAIGAYTLVITNFIEGQLVGFVELPESIHTRLAEMVGVLHNSKAELEFEHPFIDQFEIVFEDDMLKSFDTLSGLPETATPGQKTLREIILPRQAQIRADLDDLKKYQAYAKKTQKRSVVCHTDLHGGNLMTDQRGTLYILDWENALIAPPEHDLFFFAGEGGFWELFWPHYTKNFPSATVDPHLLRFYFYRRALEDIADFIFRILRRENNPARDQEELGWMLECLEGIPQIEPTVAKIQGNYSAHG
jgi:Ser/Thr protein kinase RdoA (MazF antagonist)